MSTRRTVTLMVNGETRSAETDPRMLLSDFLRDRLRLTGTHVGCEHGVCGACTVHFEGQAIRSCLMLAVQADGAKVTTVEALANGDQLHPLQALFSKHRALQCGYCTPGMLMAAIDFVASATAPSLEEVREGMSSVLCRCTGYDGIVRAVHEYASSEAK